MITMLDTWAELVGLAKVQSLGSGTSFFVSSWTSTTTIARTP